MNAGTPETPRDLRASLVEIFPAFAADLPVEELEEREREGTATFHFVMQPFTSYFGGDQGAILLDGAGQQVSDIASDVNAADTTIKVSWDDWQSMAAGQLDGMTAFMTGKLRIEGDMSNAMQLQGVLAKLRG